MFLITSAAYISSGLASEFGKLPPCMLPVQNKRLYEHQVELAPRGEQIILSLPQSYHLLSFDKRRLNELGVKTVFVPDGLSLGASIVFVLNVCGQYDQPLRLLHGDTLFSKIADEIDVCAIANAEDAYEWASVRQHENDVYAGYFAFSNQSLIIRTITESDYHFIKGVESYGSIMPISYEKMDSWMDFSLENSYYSSVSKLTTQRVFNSMIVRQYSVQKSSNDIRKMNAEAHWLLSLPKSMKHYAPAVWDSGVSDGKGFYEIEYYFLSSLANLFVFGENKPYVWKEIIDDCCQYLDDEHQYKPDDCSSIARQNNKLYAEKTLSRLQKYMLQSGLSIEHRWRINGHEVPSLLDIAMETDSMISKNEERFATLMHGDFCFSNILYDFKSKSIKVIDPRGLDNEGNINIYGDFRYDVAKLAHSVLGLYDFVIGGKYDYQENGPYDIVLNFEINDVVSRTQEYFCSRLFGGYSIEELNTYPILVHLFLSMIPLHHDHPKRQQAMLANALRLYLQYIKKQ